VLEALAATIDGHARGLAGLILALKLARRARQLSARFRRRWRNDHCARFVFGRAAAAKAQKKRQPADEAAHMTIIPLFPMRWSSRRKTVDIGLRCADTNGLLWGMQRWIAWALVTGMVAVAACDDEEDLCDARCECEGCSPSQYDDCVYSYDRDARNAEFYRCEDYYDMWIECQHDTYICAGRDFETRCGWERDRFNDCVR
jgi:hypothetical protein